MTKVPKHILAKWKAHFDHEWTPPYKVVDQWYTRNWRSNFEVKI